MTLPGFTGDGVLPPGDYDMTLDELSKSALVTGEAVDCDNWDAAWRATLVSNLGTLVRQLWQVGIDHIFADGSFVEEKAYPHDIDGYFECDTGYLVSGRLAADLNALDPNKVWTWAPTSRRPDPNSAKSQLPMWHIYHVELYPHLPGSFCGITDRYGHALEFPSAFRQSRNGFLPKGIIRIVKS